MLELSKAIEITSVYLDQKESILSDTDFTALVIVNLAARVLLKLTAGMKEAFGNQPLT